MKFFDYVTRGLFLAVATTLAFLIYYAFACVAIRAGNFGYNTTMTIMGGSHE